MAISNAFHRRNISTLHKRTNAIKEMVGGHTAAFEIGQRRPALSQLPIHIKEAIGSILKGYPRSTLKPDVTRILELNKEACQIRAEYIIPEMRPTAMSIAPDELPKTIIEYGERESIAYLAWQMPFAFSVLERIFNDIKKRIPDFTPRKIFDFGIGPGTAILATENAWNGAIKEINGVDISENMLQLAGKMLAMGLGRVDAPKMDFQRFLSLNGNEKEYDLTVAAFSLNDLPDDAVRKMTVEALWKQTKDILVLVERGTPEGARIISNARKQILLSEGYVDKLGETIEVSNRKSDLHIVAPCPHEKKCPMIGSWCHFSQRVEMNKFQMETHHVGKGFIDQKFSYLVLRRGPRPSIDTSQDLIKQSFHWPRLIRRPLKRQGHTINDYCDVDSTFKRVNVPRSQGKQIFYDARKCKWGDLWPHPPKNRTLPIETLLIKPRKHTISNQNKKNLYNGNRIRNEFENQETDAIDEEDFD